LPADDRKTASPPKRKRVRIEDATIEAAQEVLKDNPDGVLCLQDELSGFFGMFDKYAGNRGGGSKDRSFWLQAWNGGEYVLDRVSRGSVLIENLSVSLLGGVQPDVVRRLAAVGLDDGLLQRACPVVMRPATIGRDEPMVDTHYGELIDALHQMKPPMADNFFNTERILRFDAAAQEIRRELEKRHRNLQNLEAVNKKFASHIGKYDGVFARLCVIWHCVESADAEQLPIIVTASTARRVAKFMHDFLLPHAAAFYAGVLGLSDDHEQLSAVAGYVLAHRLDKITNRDVQRGSRTMRGMTKRDIEKVFEQLDAFGWISRVVVHHPGYRPSDPPHWIVNPEVHRLFRDRAQRESSRRLSVREAIADAIEANRCG